MAGVGHVPKHWCCRLWAVGCGHTPVTRKTLDTRHPSHLLETARMVGGPYHRQIIAGLAVEAAVTQKSRSCGYLPSLSPPCPTQCSLQSQLQFTKPAVLNDLANVSEPATVS
eukprot:4148-Chlamydomonas_euryale.AAC.1